MDETNPNEKFVNKRIRIVQTDNFIKSGLCNGYNEHFIFIKFDDGQQQAIAFNSISQIKILEEDR